MAHQLTIFDLDGVIIDSEGIAARTLARHLTESGYPVTEEAVIERFIGTGVPGILERISAEAALAWPAGFREELEALIEQEVYREISLMPGIESVLSDQPADGWCIASNSRHERIERCLELAGLADRFHPPVFSASMVDKAKPAPDLLLFAAGAFGVPPERCIVVEDTVVGVRAGRAAGMRVIGFLGGSHVRSETHAKALFAAGADELAGDCAELQHRLRNGIAPRN